MAGRIYLNVVSVGSESSPYNSIIRPASPTFKRKSSVPRTDPLLYRFRIFPRQEFRLPTCGLSTESSVQHWCLCAGKRSRGRPLSQEFPAAFRHGVELLFSIRVNFKDHPSICRCVSDVNSASVDGLALPTVLTAAGAPLSDF